jgi:hypothetical protein
MNSRVSLIVLPSVTIDAALLDTAGGDQGCGRLPMWSVVIRRGGCIVLKNVFANCLNTVQVMHVVSHYSLLLHLITPRSPLYTRHTS